MRDPNWRIGQKRTLAVNSRRERARMELSCFAELDDFRPDRTSTRASKSCPYRGVELTLEKGAPIGAGRICAGTRGRPSSAKRKTEELSP